MKKSLVLNIAFRVGVVIFFVVIFFILYNNFILDKSLAALDISLQSLGRGEVAGVGLLLDIDSTSELAKVDFDQTRLAKLAYLSSTISQRADSKDVRMLLSNLIQEKSHGRSNFLRMLDDSTLAIKKSINNAIAFTSREKERMLKLDLKKATDAHYRGNLAAAKGFYEQVIKASGTSNYADIAKALLSCVENQVILKNQQSGILAQLEQTTDINQTQQAYFKLGILEMQIFNFDDAKKYFNKILDISTDPGLSATVKFYLGWINKQSGNLQESLKYFQELLSEPIEEKLALGSKLQMADTYKREGKFEKAAELFQSLAREHSGSDVASTALTFSKFTYIFDLNNQQKANEITAELIRYYPASVLLESSRRQLDLKDTPFEELTKVKKSADGETISKMWSTIPILGKALRLSEEMAAWYAVYMIEGSINQAIKRNIQVGDLFIIDIDAQFLTNYVRKGLQTAASRTGLAMTGFSVDFIGNNQLKAQGFLKVGPKNFKFYIISQMTLKDNVNMDLIEGEYRPDKWVIVEAVEGKLGVFDIPVGIANNSLGRANRIFNQKQIFRIENFSLTKGGIHFEGPLKLTQKELMIEKNLLDQYLKLYK